MDSCAIKKNAFQKNSQKIRCYCSICFLIYNLLTFRLPKIAFDSPYQVTWKKIIKVYPFIYTILPKAVFIYILFQCSLISVTPSQTPTKLSFQNKFSTFPVSYLYIRQILVFTVYKSPDEGDIFLFYCLFIYATNFFYSKFRGEQTKVRVKRIF